MALEIKENVSKNNTSYKPLIKQNFNLWQCKNIKIRRYNEYD